MPKKTIIISVTAIILLALGGGGLWYLKQEEQPDNPIVINNGLGDSKDIEKELDILDWQIYDARETYYKEIVDPAFSFQYPKGWKLDETLYGVEIESPDSKYHLTVDPNLEKDLPGVDTSNLKEWSIKFLQRPITDRITQIDIVEDEIQKVRDFEVYRIVYNEKIIVKNNVFSSNNEKMVFIKINNSIFAIFNENKENYPEQVVNKIIDTLEFYPK